MSAANLTDNLETRAQLFKALGHPTRLLILNLVKMKPRHGEELAAILNLKPATISHHLAKLIEVGLLKTEKDQYYQMVTLVNGAMKKTLSEMVQFPQPDLPGQVEADAYTNKVLKTFIRHGRLIRLPAQLKKQQIILEKLIEEFEPGRDYPEREVNQILLEFHEDVAALRRGFISFGLMTRDKGIYRRIIIDL